MTRNAKREYFARGKGLLSATQPQSRFILFLVFLLIAFTLLLRVFQKLAAIVELPVFLPIALVALLFFIGIAGTIYSHKFVGPLVRIRKTLEQVASGDCSVSIHLRDSDDPVMKDLGQTITRLCESSRNANQLVHETARELFSELAALQDSIARGAPAQELQDRAGGIRRKQEMLEKALQTLGR